MNKSYELNKFSQCRIWLGELPNIKFEAERIVEEKYPSVFIDDKKSFMVAAEIDIFKGSRSVYGILGAEFVPSNNNQLIVELSVSDNRVAIYEEALLLKPDIAYIGLPSEYFDAVQFGVNRALQDKATIPSGRLCLNWAAHGEAYSNSSIFKALAYFIVFAWGQEEMLFDESFIKKSLLI